ncbi:MAG: serine hydrolase [Coxiellaceae bacterium]|nr:serine hydrolase [Coxiellaceae bacterium]
MRILFRLLITGFTLIAFGCAFAATTKAKSSLEQQLQKMAKNVQQHYDISALSIAVKLPNKVEPLLITMGTTQSDNKQAVTADSLFQVGSLTKTFTAALVMGAVAKGQLRLDDTLGKWLPQYKKWRRITINQLINQTSGLPDYHASKNWWGRLYKNANKVWTSQELMAAAYPLPVNFKAGHAWAYSNTNYVLLGMIVSKATKQPTTKLMQALFTKYQLNSTYYLPQVYPKDIMARMVHGYRLKKDQTSLNGSWLSTAGGMVSTPADILKWDQMDIKKPRYYVGVNNGQRSRLLKNTAYGFGVFRLNTPQGLLYFTPGLTPGYVSLMAYEPCAGAYFSYSASRAPLPGFHGYMMTELMKVLNQYSIKKGFKAPTYCKRLKPAKRFRFPKI